MARNMCGQHYQQWRKTASPDDVAARIVGPRECKIAGCGKSAHRNDGGVRGWCVVHYKRWERNGDPEAGRTRVGALMRWIEDHLDYAGDDCIKWPFSMDERGPSTMKFRGRMAGAARVMCILAHGEPPTPDHEAAHRCGNGHEGCMNRNHLRWATCAENSQDAIRHGTHSGLRYVGENHHMAKLTNETAGLAKQMIADGYRNVEIADRLMVKPPTISSIRNGRTWRHIIG